MDVSWVNSAGQRGARAAMGVSWVGSAWDRLGLVARREASWQYARRLTQHDKVIDLVLARRWAGPRAQRGKAACGLLCRQCVDGVLELLDLPQPHRLVLVERSRSCGIRRRPGGACDGCNAASAGSKQAQDQQRQPSDGRVHAHRWGGVGGRSRLQGSSSSSSSSSSRRTEAAKDAFI
jgi:hypothetical protein